MSSFEGQIKRKLNNSETTRQIILEVKFHF
jgi:hypothetical protein